MSGNKKNQTKDYDKRKGKELELAEIFKIDPKEERFIPFEDNNAIGFSVKRTYNRDKTKFIPAINKKGENDNVALIKIGYYDTSKELKDSKGRPLLKVTISKASNWEIKHNFIPPPEARNDEDAPTSKSLETSRNSWQPIYLERYYAIDLEKKKIYKQDSDKEISTTGLIDEIMKDHQNPSWNILTRDKSSKVINKIRIFFDFYWDSNITPKILRLLKYWFIKEYSKNIDHSKEPNKAPSSDPASTQLNKDNNSKVFGIDLGVSGSFIAFLSIIFILHYFVLQKSQLLNIFKYISPNISVETSSVAILAPFTIAIVYLLAKFIKWNLKNLTENKKKWGVKNAYFYFHLLAAVVFFMFLLGIDILVPLVLKEMLIISNYLFFSAKNVLIYLMQFFQNFYLTINV